MTTSANVTNFRIFKDGEIVGTHSQHHMCKTRWEELLRFSPVEDHEIQAHWLDEEEEYHEDEKPKNLFEFLLVQRPCPFGGFPRALHGILHQDQETGDWKLFGGFHEDHENLKKVAGDRFKPGTWKIVTTMVAVRHYPNWGEKRKPVGESYARPPSEPKTIEFP